MNDWKRSFNAIWIAEFIAIAGFATSTPIIPLYLRDLGLTDPASLNFWTGLTQASSSIAMAVFAPIWGSLADSYGRRLMLLRAMLGGALLLGLLSLATEPWQVAVLRTLQGCVTGTVSAATVLTASITPIKEVGYRLGLLQMAVYLGMLVLAALIVTRYVKEEFIPKPRTGSLFRNAIPDFSPLKTIPALAPLMGVVFAVQFAAAVVAPMLPLFIMHLTGQVERVGSLSGLIIAAGSLSGAVAAAAIGKVSGKFGYGRTLIVCMIGATVFYLPQGLVTTPWQLLWLRLGSGIFLGGTMPSVNALIASLCDKDRQGSTFGLSSSIANAGAALGPAVGATLATIAGYPSVFFATSGILGGIGVAVAASMRKGGRSGTAGGGRQ